jgi:N-methylhydantoinase B/oxoprolinase/acetone carboxylase alpha subunit
MTAIDPITLEVLRHKFEGIAEEMETTLLRSSFSPIVKEGMDASASLFTPEGVTLAQACAIPIHLGTLIPCLATMMETFPPAEMQPGDIYMMNDPYCGGTHLPDIAVIMPVIIAGQLVAFSAAMTHHQDIGGMSAGSVPTNATEVFQEGLRIPPVRWARGGEFDATLTALLRQNVRIPDTFIGDLNAQVAACKVGIRRLGDLVKRHGAEFLAQVCEHLLDRSEAMTRAELKEIPDGSYSYVDYLDNDGIALDQRIRIEVNASIAGDSVHFDLSGTSSQVTGPMNCVPSGSLAAACFALRAITDPSIPGNGGCFRPIRLTLPEGSLVNPHEPAPVNARTATIKRITGCMLGALAQAVPDRVPASPAGELLVMAFGGRLKVGGTAFVTGELIAGGSGAGAGHDGIDGIETDATNCMNLPAEAMEMEAPIRVHRVSLRPDSGGAGQYRGGLGVIKEFEFLHGPVSLSHRGERHFAAAAGLAGGEPGALARSLIVRADGRHEEIPSKMVSQLAAGDRLRVETAGGGGFGAAAQRDRAAVETDLADGKVSREAARKCYGWTGES